MGSVRHLLFDKLGTSSSILHVQFLVIFLMWCFKGDSDTTSVLMGHMCHNLGQKDNKKKKVEKKICFFILFRLCALCVSKHERARVVFPHLFLDKLSTGYSPICHVIFGL